MNKKYWIKIGIIVVITYVMCFSDCSFAVDGDVKEIGSIAWTLDFIVSCLSRFWVVFANIAGKFLTNNWVYGQVLGIDILLWKYWNIVKNMANFCLGFYLVYVIFKGLIGQYGGKEDVMKNLKNVLLRVLIAGIGVQASWFLTSVVIDLSTITMSAVGAFPSQVLSKNEDLMDGINKSMKDFFGEEGTTIAKGKLFSLFPEDGAANSFTESKVISLDTTVKEENLLDMLMPNKDDISGPLYYMGFAILRTQEINSIKSYSEAGLKGSILNLIIQGGTTIVYSVELGVLCVIALIRILYLWMFIVLSPLAILLACIGKAGEKELLKKGFIADLMKQINLKTFLAKVFQPVIIVFGISLSMIFVTLISRVVNSDPTRSMNDFDIGGAEITSSQDKKNTISDDTTYTTTLDGNLIKISLSAVGKGILDFIMAIITVILVYIIIDMSIEIGNKFGGGEDFLSKRIDSIQKGVNGAITSVPVVPVAGYDKDGVPTTHHMSVGQVFGVGGKSVGGKSSLIGEGIRKVQGKIDKKYEDQNQIINQWFGDNTGYLTAEEQTKITNARTQTIKGIGQLEAMKKEIKKSENGKGMTLNSSTASNKGFWIQEFTQWLEGMKGRTVTGTKYSSEWNRMIDRWNSHENDRTLEQMFKSGNETKNVEAYADLFGLSLSSNTREQLKNADISKESE